MLVGLGVLALSWPATAGAQASAETRVAMGGDTRSVATVATAVGAEPARVLASQLGYPRVREAYRRKGTRVDLMFSERGIDQLAELYLRVFKHERALEVWARGKGQEGFTLVREYPVCDISGRLGPKRRRGDFQIPEGFYEIELLNPWSEYHLSMRVSYPNAVDRERGYAPDLGGDIFVHGGCATIGCVPVTDEYIEELYLMVIRGQDAGQKRIPIHIFPTRLDEDGLAWLAGLYGSNHLDYPFWENLAHGYQMFEETGMVPGVRHHGERYQLMAP